MGERITGAGYWSLHWYDVCVFGEWKVRNMKLHEMVVCSLGFSIDCSGGFRGGKGGANAPPFGG